MAKDMAGNKLAVGNYVHVDMPNHVFGRITKIVEGGTILAGGMRGVIPGGKKEMSVTPGVVTVEVMFQAGFDPRNEIVPQLVRVVDPEPEPERKPHLA